MSCVLYVQVKLTTTISRSQNPVSGPWPALVPVRRKSGVDVRKCDRASATAARRESYS